MMPEPQMLISFSRQKFRDTNLLDRNHVVDDPRTLPEVVRRLISVHGKPPGG
jgi:hypothetical protein